MAALYTYPEHEGRARFSPAAWTGEHGKRAVDLAWEQATQHRPESDDKRWEQVCASFPEGLREACLELYRAGLGRMRAYLLERLRALRAETTRVYGYRDDGDGGFVLGPPPSAQDARHEREAKALARALLERFCEAHPAVLHLEESERVRKARENDAKRAAEMAAHDAFLAEVDRVRGTPEAAPEEHVAELVAWTKSHRDAGEDEVHAWWGALDDARRTPWGRSWAEKEIQRAKVLVHEALLCDAP